jgi:hypothetical protein
MFVIILGVGWIFTGIALYPTQSDITEIKEAIQLSKDTNLPLYNSWGEGWLITYLGKETEYKISYPDPDWNNLTKPFYAYSSTNLDCNKLNKRTYYCN